MNIKNGDRVVIQDNGTVITLVGKTSMQQLARLCGIADCFDTVILRHLGDPMMVMMVDDTGMIDGRPINQKATELYHLNCNPGVAHGIHGTVAIVPDGDFA